MSTTLTIKGQVAIPKQIRDALESDPEWADWSIVQWQAQSTVQRLVTRVKPQSGRWTRPSGLS